MDGNDVVGRARTGMGKTLAFTLPMIETFFKEKHDNRTYGRKPAGLIMAPTRELAIQVSKEFQATGPHLKVLTVYGGSSFNPQIDALRKGLDVVIGTPGRIIDHMERGNLFLDNLRFLVLDEANQMLDMGFQDEMTKVFDEAGKSQNNL